VIAKGTAMLALSDMRWAVVACAVVTSCSLASPTVPVTVTVAPYVGFDVGPDIQMTVGENELMAHDPDEQISGETTLTVLTNTDCWIQIPRYITIPGLTPKAAMKVSLSSTDPVTVPMPSTPGRQSKSGDTTHWYYPVAGSLVHKLSNWKLEASITYDWTVADPVGTFTGYGSIDVTLSM